MQNNSRTIWLVRHGNRRDFVDPEWLKAAERPHDGPLSADGEIQARETGVRLARERIDTILASPFIRAAQTATIIAEVLGKPVMIEAGLCEMLLDRWFPVRHDVFDAATLAKQFPGIDPSYLSQVQPAYPETPEQMAARTARTAAAVTARFAGNLLLVSHGAAIGGIARSLTGAPCAVHPALCCLIRLDRLNGAWTLTADGSDTSHLSSEPVPIRLH